MPKAERITAVGAGTTAGDAADEVQAPESRAAEAEVDERLESLQTTGAAPTGVQAAAAGSSAPAKPGKAGEGDSERRVAANSPRRKVAALRPEGTRSDLKRNQAGIGSRMQSDG